MSNFEDEIEGLEAYESDEEQQQPDKETVSDKDKYTAMHASGFEELLLKPEIIRAIGDAGFEHPSEVQYQCIPQAILGTDVVCQAKSGMGKTAVFVISVLQQLEPREGEVSSLVLCHTRELAYQICREFERFQKYLPSVKVGVFYGGTSVQADKLRLKNDPPSIVIGTPGRLLQLVRENDLKLNNLKYFVLDECDTMLESLDMRADVQNIFRATPHEKQTMMFSATLSDTVRPVIKKFMHNPLEIYINDGSKLTLDGLKQYYLAIPEQQKNRKLFDLLDEIQFNQVVIFVRTVQRAKFLSRLLQDGRFPSITVHSQMRQEERIRLYREFKEFQHRIMVSTDMFGRGIDIAKINFVINYDMPESADQYLHRVGRAGRFGTKGLAISMVATEEDAAVLNQVQQRFVIDVPQMPDEIDASAYMQ